MSLGGGTGVGLEESVERMPLGFPRTQQHL